MNKLLAIAATAEALTGLALLTWPPPVIRLLFGAEIAGVGAVICRIAGMSLLALGLACWPDGRKNRGFFGILTYGTLAAAYLTYLGLQGDWVGILMWPAVALHLGLSALLVVAWLRERTQVR